MRPIEYRTDMDFRQALKCVEFRVAPLRALKPHGFLMGLGLRYGLVGAAAVHHLLQFAMPSEERPVLDSAVGWSQLVTDHVRHTLMTHLPGDPEADAAEHIGKLAQVPLETAMPLLKRNGPLSLALGVAIEDFAESHRREIRQGWGLFRGGKGERLFRDLAEDSLTIALNFHERRGFDLDEVREIALLGE